MGAPLALRLNQEIIDKLRRAFDLSGYEAKLYIALLYGARNPKEASSLSGVPLPRVYDIIRLLEAKGLVQKDPEGWYTPVPPRAAVASMIARIEDELRTRVRLASAVASELEALVGASEEREATLATSLPGVASLIAQSISEVRVAYVTVPAEYDLFVNTLKSVIKTSNIEALLVVKSSDVRSMLFNDLEIAEECAHPHLKLVISSVSTPHSVVFVYEDSISSSVIGLLIKWKGFTSKYNKSVRELWEQCWRGDSQ